MAGWTRSGAWLARIACGIQGRQARSKKSRAPGRWHGAKDVNDNDSYSCEVPGCAQRREAARGRRLRRRWPEAAGASGPAASRASHGRVPRTARAPGRWPAPKTQGPRTAAAGRPVMAAAPARRRNSRSAGWGPAARRRQGGDARPWVLPQGQGAALRRGCAWCGRQTTARPATRRRRSRLAGRRPEAMGRPWGDGTRNRRTVALKPPAPDKTCMPAGTSRPAPGVSAGPAWQP